MSDLLQRIAATADAMRVMQREYFRDRTTEALRTSKALEGQLDKLLAEWRQAASGVRQESLFKNKG